MICIALQLIMATGGFRLRHIKSDALFREQIEKAKQDRIKIETERKNKPPIIIDIDTYIDQIEKYGTKDNNDDDNDDGKYLLWM